MTLISEKRLIMLNGLVKTMSDKILHSLDSALSMTSDKALLEVSGLIKEELDSRAIKLFVFKDYLPLLSKRKDNINAVLFPASIVDQLWQALEKKEPRLCQQIHLCVQTWRPNDPIPSAFYNFMESAALIAHDSPDDLIRGAKNEQSRAEVVEFAHYLDLYPIMQSLLPRMSEWLGRMDDEKANSLRVLFNDACAISQDSGLRLIEVVFSHLDDCGQIMKFVATIADDGDERFLAASEMADFGERIISRIEANFEAVKLSFQARDGIEKISIHDGVSMTSGALVCKSLNHLQTIEFNVVLNKDGPWGKRIFHVKSNLTGLVETQLKAVKKITEEALVCKSVRGRQTPRLDRPLDQIAFKRAQETLGFILEVRIAASVGGFSTLYNKVMLELELVLDGYFEELLHIANQNDLEDMTNLMTGFDNVIALMKISQGDDKAMLARRRVTSSGVTNRPKKVA